MHGDEVFAAEAGTDDLHRARQDDVDAVVGEALLEDDLAGGDLAARRVLRQARDLRGAELRKHLGATIVDDGGGAHGHSFLTTVSPRFQELANAERPRDLSTDVRPTQ